MRKRLMIARFVISGLCFNVFVVYWAFHFENISHLETTHADELRGHQMIFNSAGY